MKDELGGEIMKEFVVLTAKNIVIQKTTMIKIKNQKAQKSVS